MHLTTTLTFDDSIQPVEISTETDIGVWADNTDCWITGWGVSEFVCIFTFVLWNIAYAHFRIIEPVIIDSFECITQINELKYFLSLVLSHRRRRQRYQSVAGGQHWRVYHCGVRGSVGRKWDRRRRTRVCRYGRTRFMQCKFEYCPSNRKIKHLNKRNKLIRKTYYIYHLSVLDDCHCKVLSFCNSYSLCFFE